jgi:hypothetical protein
MQEVGSNGSDGPGMHWIAWICVGLSMDVTESEIVLGLGMGTSSVSADQFLSIVSNLF